MQFLDQLKLGWEVLAKLESEIRSRSQEAAPGVTRPQLASPEQWAVSPPSLQDLIGEIGSLPPYSIIVGACEDSSHLFLDLSDPRPGSILIAGDRQSGKTHLLQAVLASAGRLNPPRRVRYGIITPDLSEMIYLAGQPHCYQAVANDSDEAKDLIMELADIVEQRRGGFQGGAAFILAIDDLERFINALDDDLVEQVRWLVRCGPEVRVWTLATLDTENLDDLDASLVEVFDTRLLGSMSAEKSSLLTECSNAHPEELLKSQQFGIVFGEEWIPFWIPIVEAPIQPIPRRIIHRPEASNEHRNALV